MVSWISGYGEEETGELPMGLDQVRSGSLGEGQSEPSFVNRTRVAREDPNSKDKLTQPRHKRASGESL